MLKEIGLKDIITEKLWKSLEMPMNTLMPSELHVILFLLSIYKDKLIDKTLLSNPTDLKLNLEFAIESSSKYKEIYQSYKPIIEGFPSNRLVLILNVITTVNRYELEKDFNIIFDFFLYRFSEVLGKKETGTIEPIEITRFVMNLADQKKDSTVFNPFAGLASFGVFLNDDIDYLGQEINRSTWALGTLRLMAHNKISDSIFQNSDSITSWPEHKNFDLILSYPPFRMKIRNNYRDSYPNINTVEQFFLEKGISSLNETGKLIAILPLSFLYSEGKEKKIREELINKDLLETVISFPGGLLTNKNITFTIIVINKDKTIKSEVSFFDAKDFVHTKGRSYYLDDQKLLKFIKNSLKKDTIVSEPQPYYGKGVEKNENLHFKTVSNNTISELDFNLNVPRFFQIEVEGVALRNFCSIIKPRNKHYKPWVLFPVLALAKTIEETID